MLELLFDGFIMIFTVLVLIFETRFNNELSVLTPIVLISLVRLENDRVGLTFHGRSLKVTA